MNPPVHHPAHYKVPQSCRKGISGRIKLVGKTPPKPQLFTTGNLKLET
jgi:hypothetical protein